MVLRTFALALALCLAVGWAGVAASHYRSALDAADTIQDRTCSTLAEAGLDQEGC